MASLFPALSFLLFTPPAIECITDAESENAGKEPNEKNREKEYMADHRAAFQVSNPKVISVNPARSIPLGRIQNAFFPVATPPPNFS